MKNKNLISFLTIVIGLTITMCTSMLLDWGFIQKHFFRQLIVYIFMGIQLFVYFRILSNVNKKTE
jgi:uncharacterized BrkB/YihY/UPF0761 family membrane protein